MISARHPPPGRVRPTNRHNPTVAVAARVPGRLRSEIVDAQRPYSTEPPPWYNDRDEMPRGQRDSRYGDRYPNDARYGDDGGRDDPSYADDSRYADDQRYRDAYVGGYPGTDSGEHSFDVPDQRYDGESGRSERSGDDDRAGRAGRRGTRSGLELPEDGPDRTREESPRYRAEMLDRGALLRSADAGDFAAQPGGVAAASLAGGTAASGLLTPGSTGTPMTAMPPGGPAGPPPVSSPAAPVSPASSSPLLGSPSSTVYQAGSTPTQAIPAAMSGSTVGGTPKEAYRARRSGIAGLLGAVALIIEVLVLVKVLVDAITAHPTNTGGVLAGVFAMCGVPMIALGLYGLATGAAIAGGPNVGRAWLRTPLAYLPIGLILIIAAGLAA
jgi:hypothetical protein